MGHSFYRSMGFTELVAETESQYVDIAVRLGTDRAYRHQCSLVIKHLSGVIWERKEVVAEWELFLLTAVGYEKGVRGTARRHLEAIQAEDSARLRELHAEVREVLRAAGAPPTPTPLPTPSPFMPVEGETVLWV